MTNTGELAISQVRRARRKDAGTFQSFRRSEIIRLENSPDILVSTLNRYVDELGMDLVLFASPRGSGVRPIPIYDAELLRTSTGYRRAIVHERDQIIALAIWRPIAPDAAEIRRVRIRGDDRSASIMHGLIEQVGYGRIFAEAASDHYSYHLLLSCGFVEFADMGNTKRRLFRGQQ